MSQCFIYAAVSVSTVSIIPGVLGLCLAAVNSTSVLVELSLARVKT